MHVWLPPQQPGGISLLSLPLPFFITHNFMMVYLYLSSRNYVRRVSVVEREPTHRGQDLLFGRSRERFDPTLLLDELYSCTAHMHCFLTNLTTCGP